MVYCSPPDQAEGRGGDTRRLLPRGLLPVQGTGGYHCSTPTLLFFSRFSFENLFSPSFPWYIPPRVLQILFLKEQCSRDFWQPSWSWPFCIHFCKFIFFAFGVDFVESMCIQSFCNFSKDFSDWKSQFHEIVYNKCFNNLKTLRPKIPFVHVEVQGF